MGYVMVHGPCLACGRVFGYHPNRVPSIRVAGKREPICFHCMQAANLERKKAGLPPHEILPGAYEPADETEVNWDDHD